MGQYRWSFCRRQVSEPLLLCYGASLKLVDKFTLLGSSVSSTEKDIDTRLMKAWTAIDRLSIIWKSDLTDKMKRSFFQAAVVSILLYGCSTWTLTKLLKKKLDGNYTRMLKAILNKSWRQNPTMRQLYGQLPPITKTIQVRRTRQAGHFWRSKDELISDVLLWTPAYGQGSGIFVLAARLHDDDDIIIAVIVSLGRLYASSICSLFFALSWLEL